MPAILLLAWRVLKPVLPFIAAALALWAILTAIHRDGERKGRAAVVAKYQPVMDRALANMRLSAERIQTARAKAEADDLANARRVERAQNQATQETALAYDRQLAAARAAASAYAQRLRNATGTQAAGSGGGKARDTGPSDASAAAAGARPVPELYDDDLQICATNTVKALGWLAWWKKVSAIPR